MQAILALEDGRIFRGKGYGAKGECYGEVVFNTSITGYQEIFTDPSYAGQIVVLTNPEIGNYGTNSDDNEATRPYIEGLIVREFSRVSSNWRSQEVAEEYLERYKIPVLGRDRYPRAGAASARQRRHARRDLDARDRHREADRQGALDSEDGRHRPGEGSHHAQRLPVGRGRALARADGDCRREGRAAEAPRRRLRLRHQAQHPAPAGRRRLPRDRGAGDDQRRRRAGAEARRRVPVERPGRSRAGDLRAGKHSPT